MMEGIARDEQIVLPGFVVTVERFAGFAAEISNLAEREKTIDHFASPEQAAKVRDLLEAK